MSLLLLDPPWVRPILLPLDYCLRIVHCGWPALAPQSAPTRLHSLLPLLAALIVIQMTYEVLTSFSRLPPWPPGALPSPLHLPLLRHLCRHGVLPLRLLMPGRHYVLPPLVLLSIFVTTLTDLCAFLLPKNHVPCVDQVNLIW